MQTGRQSDENGSRAAAVADGLHSADELIAGMSHEDSEVRARVIPRLVAKYGDDARTLPALLLALKEDPSADVRGGIAMRLWHFSQDQRVEPALRAAAADLDEGVRWAVGYSLGQMGIPPESLGLPAEWD